MFFKKRAVTNQPVGIAVQAAGMCRCKVVSNNMKVLLFGLENCSVISLNLKLWMHQYQ